MYTDKNQKIVELIYRQVLGSITNSEKEYLDGWLNEAKEHRTIYEELVSGKSLNHFTGTFSGISGHAIIENIKRTVNRRRRRRTLLISSTAAGLLLIGALIFSNRLPIIGERFSGGTIGSNLDVLPPGNPRAVLSYGDNQVMLTEEGQESEWEKYVEPSAEEQALKQTQYVRVEIPRGGEYKLRLGDGTEVWLNSESELEYPVEFTGNERAVRLRGEAYFEVANNADMPFIVQFGNARIKVLGTSFNVTAYADEMTATATLVSGKIEISKNGTAVELTPGKQAILSQNSSDINVYDVDTSIYSAWTQGVFRFEDMRLEDICLRLSRWYDVTFEFEDTAGDEKFTGGTWKYVPLGSFLAGVEKTTDVKFRYENYKVIVSKK